MERGSHPLAWCWSGTRLSAAGIVLPPSVSPSTDAQCSSGARIGDRKRRNWPARLAAGWLYNVSGGLLLFLASKQVEETIRRQKEEGGLLSLDVELCIIIPRRRQPRELTNSKHDQTSTFIPGKCSAHLRHHRGLFERCWCYCISRVCTSLSNVVLAQPSRFRNSTLLQPRPLGMLDFLLHRSISFLSIHAGFTQHQGANHLLDSFAQQPG